MIDGLITLDCEQPPSGGCVLKPIIGGEMDNENIAAAFGWLCVETLLLVDFTNQMRSSRLRVAVC